MRPPSSTYFLSSFIAISTPSPMSPLSFPYSRSVCFLSFFEIESHPSVVLYIGDPLYVGMDITIASFDAISEVNMVRPLMLFAVSVLFAVYIGYVRRRGWCCCSSTKLTQYVYIYDIHKARWRFADAKMRKLMRYMHCCTSAQWWMAWYAPKTYNEITTTENNTKNNIETKWEKQTNKTHTHMHTLIHDREEKTVFCFFFLVYRGVKPVYKLRQHAV